MEKQAICERCKELINVDQDLYVTLGTHQGKETTDMRYFHFNCWRLHFEEKAREKAQAVVDGMEKRMMPIAKQMTDKLKNAIGQTNETYNIN